MLTRDVSPGTPSQEINFWLSFEWALDGIEAQLRSEDDTDLVHKYNQLMKDFPLKRSPLLHRPGQSTRITRTHFLPAKPETQTTPLPNPSSSPARRSNLTRFQRRPCPDFNIPPARNTHLTAPSNVSPAETTARGCSGRGYQRGAREVTRKRRERFLSIMVVPAHGKLLERERYSRE